LIGLFQAESVETATLAAQQLGELERAAAVFAAKDHAWRSIFWWCLTPGVVFTAGCLLLAESPRWLAQRGRIEEARTALLRTRPADEAEAELREIQQALAPADASSAARVPAADPLLSRRYVLPFLLACLILALNQATGINSVLAYVVNILNQAGLPGTTANAGDVALKVLNALMTIVAVVLVDRKGRKFLLMLGTAGIVIALVTAGLLFRSAEAEQHDVRPALQTRIQSDSLSLQLDANTLQSFGTAASANGAPVQLTVAYSYGPFTNVQTRRSDDAALPVLHMSREDTVQPDSVIGIFFRKLHLNPFADPAEGLNAPLRIERADLAAVPSTAHGWKVALAMCLFVAGFAVGPGVCVWLALSELMPTRIRSNGMSIALLINQFVSTMIAATFLPTVGQYGYATMFFWWAGATLIYFLAAAFLLPETKGKTLEEIEAHFAGR
jgi:MFS family permease